MRGLARCRSVKVAVEVAVEIAVVVAVGSGSSISIEWDRDPDSAAVGFYLTGIVRSTVGSRDSRSKYS
jgi:hypothetical protein